MSDEPELHIIRFPADDAWRAEQARQHQESRRRHLERLVAILAVADGMTDDPLGRAEAVLDGLFIHRRREGDEVCPCACHPRLPDSDLHDYGSACTCRKTAEQRRASWDAWQADMDAYWESPEGRDIRGRRRTEEDDLTAWLRGNPAVTVTSHGGWAPEQWRGTVDGHSFYFRERHDQWRIELDLVPSGRFSEVWTGGDLDDEASFEPREIDGGEVIAQGASAEPPTPICSSPGTGVSSKRWKRPDTSCGSSPSPVSILTC